MLLEYWDVQNIWLDVQSWIQQLGYEDFTLTNNKIIMGVLEIHHNVINLIIDKYVKVCIHLGKIKKIYPNFFSLKKYIKRM